MASDDPTMQREGPADRPLSVFFLIRSLNVGGSERQLICLAKGLSADGHGVTVAVYYAGALDRELAGSGVRLVNLGKSGRFDIAGMIVRLARAIREARPDIVYSFLATSNILASLVRPFCRRAKLVWGVRASDMDLKAYDRLTRLSYAAERLLSKRADLIIANSRKGRDFAVSTGFPRERMIVIPNGIDTERFRPDREARLAVRRQWAVQDGETVIGLLARIDPMKDHATFVRAAAIVAAARKDSRFVCVGADPEGVRPELEALAHSLGIGTSVLFAGEHSDPVEALNAFDICCSSSRTEGFSNSVAEAMACGIPCAVTDVGDSALIVGSTGRVAPAGDPGALADAILGVMAELGPRLGEAARARVVENFSVAALVERSTSAFRAALRA
jgi:glycosyltransferase involved in cell wall biosynthesis